MLEKIENLEKERSVSENSAIDAIQISSSHKDSYQSVYESNNGSTLKLSLVSAKKASRKIRLFQSLHCR